MNKKLHIRKIDEQLVNHLVALILFFSHSFVYGKIKRFDAIFNSKSARVFISKNSILAISKNASHNFDYYYLNDNFEFRIFFNKNSKFTFVRKSEIGKSLIIGNYLDLNTKKSFFSFFEIPAEFRNYQDQICEQPNSVQSLRKISDEYSKFISAMNQSEVIDTRKLFDDSCENVLSKEKIVSSLKSAVKTANDDFKKCLIENTDNQNKVAAELESNDEFRRIMIVYYTNSMLFAKRLFSGNNPIKISCSKDERSDIAKVLPSSGVLPSKLLFSEEILNKTSQISGVRKFETLLKKIMLHELNHVFHPIPSVNDPQLCEHKYSDLIQQSCSQFEGFKIPNCKGNPTNSESEVIDRSNGALVGRLLPGEIVKPDPPRSPDQNQPQATGVKIGDGQEKLMAIAGASATADSASPRPTSSNSEARSGEASLTTLQAGSFSAVTEPIFSAAQNGNTRIRDYTDQLFRAGDQATQSRLAGAISEEFDRTSGLFDKAATGIKAIIGESATAATIPQSGLVGVGATNWTTDSALDAYLTGSPNAGTITTTVQQSLARGATLTSSVGAASQASSTVNQGLLANTGSADAKGLIKSDAPVAVSNGTSGIGSSSSVDSARSVVAGKLSNSGGISTIASANGPVLSDSMGRSKAPQMSGTTSLNESNPYQPRNETGIVIKDSPQIRILSAPNVKISGNTYQEIRRSYGEKDFQESLKGLGYSIEITDRTGAVISKVGAGSSLSTQRKPSSVSGPETSSTGRAIQPEEIKVIFIDDGKSIRRKGP